MISFQEIQEQIAKVASVQGTGAAVAMGIIRNAVETSHSMATMQQVGVSL